MRRAFRILAALAILIGLCSHLHAQVPMTGAGKGAPGGGGFTPSCAQSSTFLAAATDVTLTADKMNYDTTICGVAADFGGTLPTDVWYIWAAPTQATALINVANPGTFNGTLHGTVSFTAYQGFTGDGSTFYIDSGFNPSTATSPNFVQNSATVGVYVLTNRTTPATVWNVGCASGGCSPPGPLFSVLNSGGNMNGSINSATAAQTTSATAQGAWNLTRTTAVGDAIFLNSSENPAAQSADTSVSVSTVDIIFFGFNSGFGLTSDQMAAGWIGQGVGGVNPSDGVKSCKINNRINTYMATLATPKNVYSNSPC